ncbi:hypothetical protein GCM10010335_38360 [Streptomyces galbus]|uniref:Peptidase n=1 Tax=Streptomyces galbus TaxID=33898 RepID=A0A4U5X7I9_STRGB|nr:hypothetical protein E4U92_01970 [Streptomyces galbus]GHD38935.1 hypothetical protein GCM10010335_38360 [Streptomyces galbus]
MRITAGAVTLCAAVALAAPQARAADAPSYAFAAGARTVPGATGTADAVRLAPGTTYRSTLSDAERTYYRLELDDASSTYVSVTAVPRPGAPLDAGDGIRVSVQDADGLSCSSFDSATVGATGSPRPLTAWGAREVVADRSLCRTAGTYYVVVERARPESASQPWDLELAPVSEPPLARPGATRAPGAWDSATPAPPAGEAVDRPGGAGFATAAAVGPGAWRSRIVPGQTLFYVVPVGWGQQPDATVEIGSTGGRSADYVGAALSLTLHNPVRAEVESAQTGYGGSQKSAALAPVPPVSYANRYAVSAPVNGMRFAGSYYLVVHLAAEVGEKFGDGPYGVVLRVGVRGSARPGPEYAGESVPRGMFGAGASGGPGGAGGHGGDLGLRVLAAGGIGTGSALLLGLAVWTVTARRRDAAQIRANAQNPTA